MPRERPKFIPLAHLQHRDCLQQSKCKNYNKPSKPWEVGGRGNLIPRVTPLLDSNVQISTTKKITRHAEIQESVTHSKEKTKSTETEIDLVADKLDRT